MKKSKILSIVMGLLVAYQSISQEGKVERFPDSLKIETDFGGEVTFTFRNMSNKGQYVDNELWKSMLSIMESAVNNSDLDGGLIVTYEKKAAKENENVLVTVQELEDKSDILIIDKSGTKQLSANRVEYKIWLPNVRIFFLVNENDDLQNFKSLDIESAWNEINATYTNEGNRNYYVGTGTSNYNEIKLDKIEDINGAPEGIEITFIGIGLGYYRDRFVPDLSTKLGFHLYDRYGDHFMEFGFTYTTQFFFDRSEEGKYTNFRNGWLNGFAKWRPGENNEMGVGVGSLVQRKGDFFNGATWKLTVYAKSSKTPLTFSPELVFTDNFKSVFPAMRFGFTF
ncbi:MAG: hypothetical protein AAF616_15430 [Bacteroidota bacterium]